VIVFLDAQVQVQVQVGTTDDRILSRLDIRIDPLYRLRVEVVVVGKDIVGLDVDGGGVDVGVDIGEDR